MSEDVGMYRELAEEFFPDTELTDEEVIRIGLAYTKGYRDGHRSADPPPKTEQTKHRITKTGKGA